MLKRRKYEFYVPVVTYFKFFRCKILMKNATIDVSPKFPVTNSNISDLLRHLILVGIMLAWCRWYTVALLVSDFKEPWKMREIISSFRNPA